MKQDRENRTCNIILYNIQEHWTEDIEFCLQLFNKVLRVLIKEENI